MTDQLDATAVNAAADLGRQAAEQNVIPVATGHKRLDGSYLVRVTRDDEGLETCDLERLLPTPREARGGAQFHDAESFAAYVAHINGESTDALGRTTVWADDQARRIVAVFNDHDGNEAPGWRDHTATYTARVDPDWDFWRKRDDQLLPQIEFGEFLQDMAHTIASPPAAELFQVATTFTAKRNVTFEQSSRLQSGDVELVYREETTAQSKAGAQKVEVPERFTLRLVPFLGAESVEITARLRYRIVDGRLTLGYKLQRPDIAERQAFEHLVGVVRGGLPAETETDGPVPILNGTAPTALR